MSIEEIEQNEHSPVTRPKVPASGISLPAHLCDGDTVVDAVDMVVLIQVLYDIASNREVSPMGTWKRLQQRGIRSTKNRAQLIGKNSVYESYSRLIDAGYLERYEKPNETHPGRKGPIAYHVYDNPAWNPTWQAQQVGVDPLEGAEQAPAKPQVGTRPGTRDAVSGEVERRKETAGQNASRDQGSGVPGSGVPGSGKRVVPAGRNASPVPGSIKASPPHPPEEVGTTSPSPHKHATASRRDKQLVPEGDPAALAAAEQWLMRLPGKWAAGLQKAASLAPWLVRNAELTGWDLDTSLRLYLTRQEAGQKPPQNYGNVLAYRIKNMQPRDAVLAAAAEAAEPEEQDAAPQSSSGMPNWCGKCNRGERPAMPYMRVIPSDDPDDDSVTRCPDCHPALAGRRKPSHA